MSIDAIISALTEKVSGVSLPRKVKLDLGASGAILIDGTSTPPSVSRSDSDADVTLSLSESDLQKILDGDLNPQMAFMMGKLKVDGDMSLAMQLGQILG